MEKYAQMKIEKKKRNTTKLDSNLLLLKTNSCALKIKQKHYLMGKFGQEKRESLEWMEN